MKVLHVLASGGTGGIEVLCKNIALNSNVDNRWAFLFNEGEMYDELKENNIKVLSVINEKFFDKINKINKYCKEENIDILVMHHGGLNCNIIYCLLKKYNPNIKFIRYMHACYDKYSFGNSTNKLKNLIVKVQMQKAINCSDCIVYISEASKKSFNSKFKINTREVVIYNGIENKFFKNQKERNEKNNTINIIFIGRLVKVKGVNLLIDAFEKTSRIIENITLTIVGDGVERENLEEQVKKIDIADKVNFAGRQNNIIEWLDKSDIFVYPSIWEEGFGISVVEAMSRGCIPITFNRGALSEIIDNGNSGFIVNDVNSNSLAEKIQFLCNYEDKKDIMKNAKENSKKYTIENTINYLENEYYNLMK